MYIMKIKAQLRTELGSGAAGRARREGLIPAAIYGSSVDSISVLLDRREYERVVRELGFNGVFEIEVEGDETYQVFVKEQIKAPIKDIINHVDLQAFRKGEKVTMDIPVFIEGQEGLVDAVANRSITSVEIEIEPAKAPNAVYVDVSNLEIGDSILVSDLKFEGDVEFITDADATVVSISVAEEEVEVDEDAEMPEPEVIGASEEDAE